MSADHMARPDGPSGIALAEIDAENILRDAWCEFGGNHQSMEFWGAFSDGVNFTLKTLAAASGIEAATADETRSGSAEGKSPIGSAETPAARRILDTAMHPRAQTPDEAYADLVRLLREPADGTGPRVTQEMPFVRKAQRTRARRPLHPFYGGPAVGLLVVAVGLLVLWIAGLLGLV